MNTAEAAEFINLPWMEGSMEEDEGLGLASTHQVARSL